MVVLSFLLFTPGVLGCLWDRDTVAVEARGRGDVVKIIVGSFDRFPPEFMDRYFAEYRENLQKGIDYYRGLAEEFVGEKKSRFLDELRAQADKLEEVCSRYKAALAEGAT